MFFFLVMMMVVVVGVFIIPFNSRLQTTGFLSVSLPKVEKTIPGLAKGGLGKERKRVGVHSAF